MCVRQDVIDLHSTSTNSIPRPKTRWLLTVVVVVVAVDVVDAVVVICVIVVNNAFVHNENGIVANR